MTIEDLESKLSHRPESPLFARLAGEYLAEHRIAEAKEICLTGIQRFPQYATAHLILARCYTAESDYPSALTALEQAENLLPDSSVVKDFHDTVQRFLSTLTAREETIKEQNIEPSTETIERNIPSSEFSPTAIPENEIVADDAIETHPEESPNETETITDNLDEVAVEDIPAQPMEEIPQEIFPETNQPQENSNNPPAESFDDATTSATSASVPEPAESLADDISPLSEQVLIPAEKLPPLLPVSAEHFQEQTSAEPENIIQATVQEPVTVDSPTPVGQNVIDIADSHETRIVSKTLAEIYASQGAYDEAIITYRLLKEYRPERSAECDTRIAELENLRQEKIKE